MAKDPRQPDFRGAPLTRSHGTCSVWLGNESYDDVRDPRRKYDPPYHSLHCGGDGKLTPRLADCTEDHWMATPCLLRPLPTRPPARVHRRGYHLPSMTGGACLLPLGRVAIVKQDPRHLPRGREIKRDPLQCLTGDRKVIDDIHRMHTTFNELLQKDPRSSDMMTLISRFGALYRPLTLRRTENSSWFGGTVDITAAEFLYWLATDLTDGIA